MVALVGVRVKLEAGGGGGGLDPPPLPFPPPPLLLKLPPPHAVPKATTRSIATGNNTDVARLELANCVIGSSVVLQFESGDERLTCGGKQTARSLVQST